MSQAVQHQPGQFLLREDGLTCELHYRRDGDTVWMHHTEVPAALQGRGLAAQLVEAALAWASQEGLRVVPSCSYVARYVQRHPKWQSIC